MPIWRIPPPTYRFHSRATASHKPARVYRIPISSRSRRLPIASRCTASSRARTDVFRIESGPTIATQCESAQEKTDMTTPYVGQLQLFGFNFAPVGWALCQGQILSISQNPALFSILGTNFGGNGQTTFGLPNLQGTAAVGAGQGTGLSQYAVGQIEGATSVTVTTSTMPMHNHNLMASSATGTTLNT